MSCLTCSKRYAETLAGFHVVAFVGYMLKHAAGLQA